MKVRSCKLKGGKKELEFCSVKKNELRNEKKKKREKENKMTREGISLPSSCSSLLPPFPDNLWYPVFAAC